MSHINTSSMNNILTIARSAFANLRINVVIQIELRGYKNDVAFIISPFYFDHDTELEESHVILHCPICRLVQM